MFLIDIRQNNFVYSDDVQRKITTTIVSTTLEDLHKICVRLITAG